MLKNGANKIHLAWYSAGYFLHLWIRMAHDKTYESVPVYKNYSDKKYSSSLHKAVLTAFIVSLIFFTGFQYAWPFINPFKAETAQASSTTKFWSAGSGTAGQNFTSLVSGSTPSTTIQKNNLTIDSSAHMTTSLLLGNGNDCSVEIYGAGVTIKQLYENSAVSGVILTGCNNGVSVAGTDHGLGFGSNSYVPNTTGPDGTLSDGSAFPNFSSLTIDAGAYLTTTAGIAVNMRVKNGLTIHSNASTWSSSQTNWYHNTVTITTSSVNPLVHYQLVTLTGYTAGYAFLNGTWPVAAVNSNTQFTIATPSNYSANSNNAGVMGTLAVPAGNIYGDGMGMSGGAGGPAQSMSADSGGNGSYPGNSNGGGMGGIGFYDGGSSAEYPNDVDGGAGGSYGSSGGNGSKGQDTPATPITPGSTYAAFPAFGSGGGGGGGQADGCGGFSPGGAGGNGGGSIKITAGTISMDSNTTITANGGAGSYAAGGGGGGGSGGSIYLQVSATSPQIDVGKISAAGGAFGATAGYGMNGGAGGLGRIWVYGPHNATIPAGFTNGANYKAGSSPGSSFLGFDGVSTYTGLQYVNTSTITGWHGFQFFGTVPSGSMVTFMVREASTQAGLSSATFYDPFTYSNSWSSTTEIPAGTYTSTPYVTDSLEPMSGSLPSSNAIEIVVQFNGSGGSPTMTQLGLDYDVIDAPTSPAQYAQTGGGQIASGGFTNETNVVLKANIPDMTPIPTSVTGTTTSNSGNNTLIDSGKSWGTNAYATKTVTITSGTGIGQTQTISSNNGTTLTLGSNWAINPPSGSTYTINTEVLTPQIELIAGANPSWTGNNTTSFGTVTYSPQNFSYTGAASSVNFGTLGNLTAPTTYNWKMRFIDQAGRVGSWSAASSFMVDQTAPTVTSLTFSGSNVSGSYTKGQAVTLNIAANDGVAGCDSSNPKTCSGVTNGQMRFQNENTGWSSWQSFAATASWNLSSGDGAKTVYAQVMDAAGNTSGYVHSTTAVTASPSQDFNGVTGSGVITSNNEIKLTSTSTTTYGDMAHSNNGIALVCTAVRTNPAATQVRVTWSYVGDYETDEYLYVNGSSVSSQTDSGTQTTGWISGNSVNVCAQWGPSDATLISVDWTGTMPNTSPANQYISPVLDRGAATATSFANFNWSDSVPSGTSVVAQVQAGPNSDASGGRTYSNVTKGTDLSTLSGWQNYRYLKYTFTLNTDSGKTLTPIVYDVSVGTAIDLPIMLDTVAPTGTVNIGASTPAYLNNKNVNLTLNASDGTGSGVAYMQFSNDGSTWGTTTTAAGAISDTSGTCTTPKVWDGSTCWTPYSTTVSGWNLIKGAYNGGTADGGTDGPRTVYARYKDNAGNVAGDKQVTVTVGSQTWMANNINVGTQIAAATAQTNNGVLEKYCNSDDTNNCLNYGGQYQWDEAMQYSTTEGAQGICPTGFHIPSDSEWYTLEHYLDATINDPNATGWRGTNGGTLLKNGSFAAKLGGYIFGGGSSGAGTYGDYWTSTQNGANADYHYLSNINASVARYTNGAKSIGSSVRCIANSGYTDPSIVANTTLDTTAPTFSSVQISSSNNMHTLAKPNDVITLNMTASDANLSSNAPTVSIAGHTVAASGTSPNFTASYTLISNDAEGTVPFSISGLTDLAGNTSTVVTSTTNSSSVLFDKTNPVTTGAVTTGTAGLAGWYTSAINYRLSASDSGGSGLSNTKYCVDQLNACVPANSTGAATIDVAVSADSANNYVRWISTDNAGNSYSHDSGPLKIDTQKPTSTGAPTTSPNSYGWYTSNVNFTINTNDATSGVASTVYCVDQTNTCTPANSTAASTINLPPVTSESATNYVRFSSTDAAGLVQDVQSVGPIKIDKSAPTGTASFAEGQWSASATSPLTLNFTVNDSGSSNLANYQLSEDGITWEPTVYPISGASYTSGNIARVVTTTEGAKYAYLKVTDGAGNTNVSPIFARMAFDLTNPDAPGAVTGAVSSSNNTVLTSGNWYPYSTPQFSWNASDGIQGSGIQGFWAYFGPDQNGDPLNASLPALNRFWIAADVSGNGVLNRDLTSYGYSEGHLYLRLKSVDNVNRISDSLTSYLYNFDKTAPQAAVTGLSATTTVDGEVDLSWPALTLDENEAPVQNFKIERIKYSIYTNNGLTPNGIWKGTTLDNQTNGYGEFYTTNATGYVDSAATTPSGQPVLLGGVRYIYRISYKDTANDAYSPLPAADRFLAIGFTKDMDPPTNPSNVHAFACDGTNYCTTETMQNGRTHKGHEAMITWTGSSDGEGSGVGGYLIYRKNGDSMVDTGWSLIGQLNLPAQTVWYDNDARNLATNTEYKQTASPLLNDFTYYSYRVVAFDLASSDYHLRNTSSQPATVLPIGDDPLVNLNYHETMQTPDVTAPTVPTNAGVRRDGIDGGNPLHQELNVYWDPNFTITDNDPQGIVGKGYRIFGAGPTATLQDPSQLTFTDQTNTFVAKPNSNANSYIIKGLNDYSYYYYYVQVYDRVGNTDQTAIFSAKTGNSLMPGPVTDVTLDSTTGLSSPALGHQSNLTFYGGNTPGCQAADGTNCVTSYEVYLSQTNNKSNCGVLSDDACWLNQNTTTEVTIDDAGNKTKNLTGKDYHYTFTNLTDAATYYVRIRAKANTTDPELTYSFLNDPVATTVTPDVTAPDLPANVKIKDIYDDGLNFKRNIITWQRIATPLRNGANDFKQYKIYRSTDGIAYSQICLDGTQTILESGGCSAQYPNPLYKSDQDQGLANNYYIDLIPVAQANQYYYYYVTAEDNAGTDFKDANSQIVYAHSNESQPTKDKNGLIESVSLNPATTQPSICDVGTGPNNCASGNTPGVKKADFPSAPGVASATIHWVTDQASDSMVEFRIAGSGHENDPYRQIGSGDSSRNLGMTTDHTVNLFGLSPGLTYEYIIVSRNFLSNPVTASGDQLPTLTTSSFSISGISTSSTTTTATVSWTTNIRSDGNYVEYQMQGVGNASGGPPMGQDMSPVTDPATGLIKENLTQDEVNKYLLHHTVVIGGLKSAQAYTYKIRCVSPDGFVTYSSLATFSTRSFDTSQFSIAPSSSNIADRNITSTTAQIVWQTSVPTTSWIEYGTATGSYGTSAGDNGLSNTHVVTLTGLVPGTKYYYRARVKDANDVEYTSPEYTFTAVIKPKISNLQVKDVTPYSITIAWDTNVDTETVLNWGKTASYGEKHGNSGTSQVHQVTIDNLDDNTEYHYQIVAHDAAGNEVVGEDAIVRTPLDTEGPKITNVKTDIMPLGDSDTTAQVIISWTTNKPATTLVQYDEGIIGGHYTKSSTEDMTLNSSHTVIIKGLNVATTYHYHIVSKDKRSNTTTTNDYTFVTPSQQQSIWNLIVNSLQQTFSWTKNLGNLFKRK